MQTRGSSTRIWRVLALTLVLALPALRPAWAGPSAREVTIKTADRLEISATFHPAAKAGGPGVVLLPMFKSDRTAWSSLIRPLVDRGVAVLALDPRGHGRSAKQGRRNLGARVAKRDKAIFKAMYKDVAAATAWLVKEGDCDADRIVLVGASVGFSVAIDAASRNAKGIAAIVGLSPVAKTLGLDTLKKLKSIPADLPILLLVHQEEAGFGAEVIVEARPQTRLVIYHESGPSPNGQERGWASGTRMFGRLPLVEQTIASFVVAATGSKIENVVLDGLVTDEGPNADPWAEAKSVGLPDADGSVRAFRVGRRILFGGTVPENIGGLRFEVSTGPASESEGDELILGSPQFVGVDLGDGTVTWSWGGMGSVPNFPGMGGTPLFGKTVPKMRVVHASDGTTTFEGEWFIPRFGDDSEGVRLLIECRPEPPPRPEGGMAVTTPQYAVSLPAR